MKTVYLLPFLAACSPPLKQIQSNIDLEKSTKNYQKWATGNDYAFSQEDIEEQLKCEDIHGFIQEQSIKDKKVKEEKLDFKEIRNNFLLESELVYTVSLIQSGITISELQYLDQKADGFVDTLKVTDYTLSGSIIATEELEINKERLILYQTTLRPYFEGDEIARAKILGFGAAESGNSIKKEKRKYKIKKNKYADLESKVKQEMEIQKAYFTGLKSMFEENPCLKQEVVATLEKKRAEEEAQNNQ